MVDATRRRFLPMSASRAAGPPVGEAGGCASAGKPQCEHAAAALACGECAERAAWICAEVARRQDGRECERVRAGSALRIVASNGASAPDGGPNEALPLPAGKAESAEAGADGRERQRGFSLSCRRRRPPAPVAGGHRRWWAGVRRRRSVPPFPRREAVRY